MCIYVSYRDIGLWYLIKFIKTVNSGVFHARYMYVYYHLELIFTQAVAELAVEVLLNVTGVEYRFVYLVYLK